VPLQVSVLAVARYLRWCFEVPLRSAAMRQWPFASAATPKAVTRRDSKRDHQPNLEDHF